MQHPEIPTLRHPPRTKRTHKQLPVAKGPSPEVGLELLTGFQVEPMMMTRQGNPSSPCQDATRNQRHPHPLVHSGDVDRSDQRHHGQ
jgi:hypothetical protein